jgi:dihydrolipoamide dehydrogenase
MHIAVLGGGPGGYSAAFEAARLGATVTLVERERLGGTCLLWGCIPTKTILRSAHIARDTRQAESFGLVGSPATVDVDALRLRKESVVDEMVGQLEGKAQQLKVEVVHGEGRMSGPRQLTAKTPDGDVVVDADAVILATGSVPLLLPMIDHSLEGVWTSDEATTLSEIPPRIVIVGGGVIGLEFADAYVNFGSRVEVVELTPSVLPGNDRRVQREAQKALEGLGVTFHLEASAEGVQRSADGLVVRLSDGSVLETDVVLSAPGRIPNSEGFGFGDVGVEMDRAAVKVDELYRTSLPNVYAIGDLIGGMMLAHVAESEGEAAARNAVAELSGEDASHHVDLRLVPAAVYTQPGVGVVGWTRDGAKDRGIDAVQAVAKFTGNGKALAEGEAEGFVQIAAEKGTGRILGAQIVGPDAPELIQEISVPMAAGMTVAELGESVFGHPTLSEVIMYAARDAARKCRL